MCIGCIVLAWSTTARAQASDDKPDSARSAASQEPEDGTKLYAPGVRINWKKREIEVDARVVFREGPLELLACSPQTREHESILAVTARPLHIHQAMGLIGLDPGSPVIYDRENDRWFPPKGERLRLEVQYQKGGKAEKAPAERWLRQIRSGQSPGRIDWVFAGSRTWPDGRFGADIDGTVGCVVDFETALIAVGDLHSADNELLWLEANTEEIPPIGTRCMLIISSADRNKNDEKSPGASTTPPSDPVRDRAPEPDPPRSEDDS